MKATWNTVVTRQRYDDYRVANTMARQTNTSQFRAARDVLDCQHYKASLSGGVIESRKGRTV